MTPAPGECVLCNGLLGDPVQPPATTHPLCAWIRPADVAALRPWFQGILSAVSLSPE